jgi:tyrosine-protein phosphatase YwqE
MLNFFSKKKIDSTALSWIQADMHSHLIPGIDDGAPDIETSIAMIKGLMECGFKKLITTPHVLSDLYPNSSETITNGLQELKKAVLDEGIEVELHAAAEYFIDDHFEKKLKENEPLLTISENKVLVEFSMITAPFDLKDVLFELQMQGYQPIIAHPERYIYMNNKRVFFEDLKASDCMFQINLLSLSGYYGVSVQELADYLIKQEMYDFAGTDLHTVKQLDALHRVVNSPIYKRLKDSEQIKNSQL